MGTMGTQLRHEQGGWAGNGNTKVRLSKASSARMRADGHDVLVDERGLKAPRLASDLLRMAGEAGGSPARATDRSGTIKSSSMLTALPFTSLVVTHAPTRLLQVIPHTGSCESISPTFGRCDRDGCDARGAHSPGGAVLSRATPGAQMATRAAGPLAVPEQIAGSCAILATDRCKRCRDANARRPPVANPDRWRAPLSPGTARSPARSLPGLLDSVGQFPPASESAA